MPDSHALLSEAAKKAHGMHLSALPLCCTPVEFFHFFFFFFFFPFFSLFTVSAASVGMNKLKRAVAETLEEKRAPLNPADVVRTRLTLTSRVKTPGGNCVQPRLP
jgi:hypothetical protein